MDIAKSYKLSFKVMTAVLAEFGFVSRNSRQGVRKQDRGDGALSIVRPIRVPEGDPLAGVDHRRYEWQRADADHLDSVLTAHLVSLGIQRRGVPFRDATLVGFGERYD